MSKKRKLKAPFFSVNTKSYIYGQEVLDLAVATDKIAKKYSIDIFFTAQLVDLAIISKHVKCLILSAQHMDNINLGVGMGKVLPEAIKYHGIDSVTLNHAECPLTFTELQRTIERANEVGLITKVCANTVEESRAIAMLNPDCIVCEETERIGTGITSGDEYIKETIRSIKAINRNIIVSQGAGIKKPADVSRMMKLGSQGSGSASGIIFAEDRVKLIEEFVVATLESYEG